jgi:hypothetical protein
MSSSSHYSSAPDMLLALLNQAAQDDACAVIVTGRAAELYGYTSGHRTMTAKH